MSSTADLAARRDQLRQKIAAIGDLRPGSLITDCQRLRRLVADLIETSDELCQLRMQGRASAAGQARRSLRAVLWGRPRRHSSAAHRTRGCRRRPMQSLGREAASCEQARHRQEYVHTHRQRRRYPECRAQGLCSGIGSDRSCLQDCRRDVAEPVRPALDNRWCQCCPGPALQHPEQPLRGLLGRARGGTCLGALPGRDRWCPGSRPIGEPQVGARASQPPPQPQHPLSHLRAPVRG